MAYRLLGNRLDSILAVSGRVLAFVGLITLALIVFAVVLGTAHADGRPVTYSGGVCPGTIGSWCVPRRGQEILENPSGGRCPDGF